MKLFNCIIDDGESIFRELLTAKSKKDMLEKYGGNGTFEKIVDVTDECFNEDTVEKLDMDLLHAGWGIGERKLICALVQEQIDTREVGRK